jgi:hypothetical protein
MESKKSVLPLHRVFNICATVAIIGSLYLFYYYQLDGVYVNRVLTFTQGVDPMNLKTDKAVYHIGQSPLVYSAFCKNRDAYTTSRWTLVNEHPHFTDTKVSYAEIPVGCYPKVGGLLQAPTGFIAKDIVAETYHFVGVVTQVLPDGRVRKQYYQTQAFQVIP